MEDFLDWLIDNNYEYYKEIYTSAGYQAITEDPNKPFSQDFDNINLRIEKALNRNGKNLDLYSLISSDQDIIDLVSNPRDYNEADINVVIYQTVIGLKGLSEEKIENLKEKIENLKEKISKLPENQKSGISINEDQITLISTPKVTKNIKTHNGIQNKRKEKPFDGIYGHGKLNDPAKSKFPNIINPKNPISDIDFPISENKVKELIIEYKTNIAKGEKVPLTYKKITQLQKGLNQLKEFNFDLEVDGRILDGKGETWKALQKYFKVEIKPSEEGKAQASVEFDEIKAGMKNVVSADKNPDKVKLSDTLKIKPQEIKIS